MATAWEDLKDYLQTTTTADDPIIEKSFDVAEALVNGLIGDTVHADLGVDGVTRYQLLMVTGAEVFNQRKAPNGIAQFASFDGTSPVRVARDPLTGAYPIISRYKVMGL